MRPGCSVAVATGVPPFIVHGTAVVSL